jgi:hypothetical protein
MNFGSLQIATLWRLVKGGTPCNGLVVEGSRELRLVVTEGDRIVQWERFPTAGMLRDRAVSLIKQRRRAGWKPTQAAAIVPSDEQSGER